MKTNPQQSNTVREIKPAEWKNQPVIACFGELAYYVGKNGLCCLNYEELSEEARDLVAPLREQLMMADLGMIDEGDGHITWAIDLDEEGEKTEEVEISGHNFFTCPHALASRAQFLEIGMRVRGHYTGVKHSSVTGEIIGGNWSYVTLRDATNKEHPSVPVSSLIMLL